MMRRVLAGCLALGGCGDTASADDAAAASTTSSDDASSAPPSTSSPTSTSAADTSASATTAPQTEATTADVDPTGDASTSTGAPTSTGGEPECPQPMPCAACTCDADGWACDCPPLLAEAGFIDLEPVDFIVGEGAKAQARSSSPARMFYNFHPAADGDPSRPLFVLFNGGPGAATGVLMAFGTGPVRLGPEAAQNPASWTTMGHLLYVDARGTGFSYLVADDPSNDEARADAMELGNFNSYLDAADFVRVIMRFLAARPQLAQSEVVIVGESYGGVRATLIVNMLLFFADFDAGGPGRYDDPALVAEIEAFLAARDPTVRTWTPDKIAGIFGRQVLLQPSLGDAQRVFAGQLLDLPGSPIFQLADELGVTFTPCSEKGPDCLPWANALQFVEGHGRSRYDLDAKITWLADLFASTQAGLSDLGKLEAVLAVPPLSVVGLPADQRPGAFRMAGVFAYPKDGGDITQLGALAAWDRYYLPFFSEANDVMRSPLAEFVGVGAGDELHEVLFLRNLAYVDTFITAAARDVAIYAPSIPLSLAAHDDLLIDVTLDPDAPDGAARPGELRVQYVAAPFPGEPAPGLRRVRFPAYDASHTVSLDQPQALRDDVAAWLAAP